MLLWPILGRLGVPIGKTSSYAVARWSSLYIEDKIIVHELEPGVVMEIELDFDNEEAEQTFLLAFLVQAGLTAWSLKHVPEATRVFRAAQVAYTAARTGGASRGSALVSSRVAGKGAGMLLGKLLLVDTIIWVGSMGIDGILNFFMEEEDQGVFADMYGGWSPLGEAFVWIGEKLGLIPEEEDLEDPLALLIEEASNQTTLGAAILVIMTWFLEEYPKITLNIDSEIYTQTNLDASWFGIQESFNQPAEDVWMAWIELVMPVLVVACVGKIAWRTGRSVILYGTGASGQTGAN